MGKHPERAFPPKWETKPVIPERKYRMVENGEQDKFKAKWESIMEGCLLEWPRVYISHPVKESVVKRLNMEIPQQTQHSEFSPH